MLDSRSGIATMWDIVVAIMGAIDDGVGIAASEGSG